MGYALDKFVGKTPEMVRKLIDLKGEPGAWRITLQSPPRTGGRTSRRRPKLINSRTTFRSRMPLSVDLDDDPDVAAQATKEIEGRQGEI
jgi:hypothetical protein